ncbi:MAG: 23S rRNA (adenine(2503)-C(2))-methyltransferase RlmN [Spirochaetia bacterium]|nr:23S rRNA (adenine(2503)-C(2))-methyltransferase RlmN [Spirochaetia bacterium]
MTNTSLYGLSIEQIYNTLNLEKKFQAKQIYQWLIKGVTDFNLMSNISKNERERLVNEYKSPISSKVIDTQIDETGATKLAIELHDGSIIESVMLIDKNDRKTACLSSQVGCAMGCKFCRTGTMGLIRNLTSSEIIEQFVHLRKLGNITHIVYMGMGEPLANLAPVLESIRFFHSEDAFYISLRRITISTCGIVSGINKITEQNLNVKLAVSLVSAENPLRSKIMPINDTFNLQQLKKSLLHYQNKGGSRFTLEYCMLSGVNCDLNAAKKLASFTNGLDAVVNLIPWNPAAELPWTTPTTEEINTFTKYLDEFHISYARRYTRGRSVNGACGQLATKNNKKGN